MKTLVPASSLALALALFSAPALAYVGPGAGLGVIGTLFGIVAAIVLAMFGLFWYPLKRAFGKKSAAAGTPVDAPSPGGTPLPDAPADVQARAAADAVTGTGAPAGGPAGASSDGANQRAEPLAGDDRAR